MELHAAAVRHAGVQMHVEVREIAAHVERDVERLRQRRRAQAAGKAADVAHVGLRDVDRFVHQVFAQEGNVGGARAARRERHAGRPADLRHQPRIGLHQRILEPREVVGLDHLGEAHRLRELAVLVGVHHERDAVAQRLAQVAHPRRVLDDILVARLAEHAFRRLRARGDGDLQLGMAFADQLLCHLDQLRLAVAGQPERDVDRALLARAAQQLPDRLLERLAADVPQRDVHQARSERPRAHEHLVGEFPVHRGTHRLGPQRVHAGDFLPHLAVDEIGDREAHRIAGERVSLQPVVGLDLDEHDERVLCFLDQREVVGHAQHVRRGPGDFHGTPPGKSGL